MKKVISLLLSIVMCLSLGVPAFAADVDTGDSIVVDQDAGIAAQADTGTASDMRLTLPTAITVHDDRMGGYTVSSAEVRNDSAAKATITGVTVTPAQHWSIMDWDSTRANVPVNSKTFSMKVFGTAIDTEGNLPEGTTLPQFAAGTAADMNVSFWMAPQSDAYGNQQVADIVVTAEFEDLTGKPINVTVENHTDNAATVTEPSDGWRFGTNTFSVSCDNVCAVGLLRNGVMTELAYTTESGAEHTYEVTLQDGDTIVVVLLGDVNLDAYVGGADPTYLMQYVSGHYNAGYAKVLTMDVNHDGRINDIDSKSIMGMLVGIYTFSWASIVPQAPQVTELPGTFDSTVFTMGQSETGETTGTLSLAYSGETKMFTEFVADVDWTELASVTDSLAFDSVFGISNVITDGSYGATLGVGDEYEVDIGTLSEFVSKVISYSGDLNRVPEILNLTFTFNGNLAPGTYEVSITIWWLCNGDNYDAPIYYADEDHPIQLIAVLEVTDTAAATMDAAALDSMTATPPTTDDVTAPAESGNTYEVDPDTEVVETPETPEQGQETPTEEPSPEPTPEPEPPAAGSDPVTKPDEAVPENPDSDVEELDTGEPEAGGELIPEQTATA